MYPWTERTQLLLGEENTQLLRQSHILVVGLGGVGAYLAESLCRAGIGKLTLADGDEIKPSNINRQLLALHSTIGSPKAELLKIRLKDINPTIELSIISDYLRDERLKDLVEKPYDYVADAIDTLSPKLFLLADAVKYGHRIVSSMGAGGRIHPEKIRVADISQTFNCPLALLLRKRLRKQGIYSGIKAVFSEETIIEGSQIWVEDEPNKKTTVGTLSYMPAFFGLFMASVIIRDLIKPV